MCCVSERGYTFYFDSFPGYVVAGHVLDGVSGVWTGE